MKLNTNPKSHGYYLVPIAAHLNSLYLRLIKVRLWLAFQVDYVLRSTTFWGRLPFFTLVFLPRLCFEVDHVSRLTMYRDSTVYQISPQYFITSPAVSVPSSCVQSGYFLVLMNIVELFKHVFHLFSYSPIYWWFGTKSFKIDEFYGTHSNGVYALVPENFMHWVMTHGNTTFVLRVSWRNNEI